MIMRLSRERLLYRLGLFEARRKKTVLAAALVWTAVMGVLAYRLEFNLGFLNLLNRNDPEVHRVDYVNENFGGMDYAFVIFEADPVASAKRFADLFAERIRGSEMVSRVVHRVEADDLLDHAFLFLDDADLDEFRDFLADNQTALTVMFRDARLAPFLTTFNNLFERLLIEEDDIEDPADAKARLDAFGEFIATMERGFDDPEAISPRRVRQGLLDLFLPAAEDRFSDFREDYFLSEDRKAVLLLIMPSEPGDDMLFTKRFTAYLEGVAAELASDVPGVTVHFAGNAPILRDEYNALRFDTRMSTAITFVAVLLIFAFFFRKLSDLALIGVALAVGIVWTYGLTYLAIGYLGVTTAFIAAILLGLGIDFAIHLIARYNEELANAPDVAEAIARAMGRSGPGIVTGAVTTSAAFLALLICDFKGVLQLGFVAGIGVLMMLAAMMTVLPVLLVLRDERHRERGREVGRRELLRLTGLSDFLLRHRAPALILTLAGTALMALAASNAKFNYDFRSTEPRGSRAIEANHLFQERFGKSLDYGVLYTDTVEESRTFAKKLGIYPAIGDVNDISRFIPEDQERKIPRVQALAPLVDPLRVASRAGPDEALAGDDLAHVADALSGSARVVKAVLQLAIVGGYFDVEDRAKALATRLDAFAARVRPAGDAVAPGASRYQQVFGEELEKLADHLHASARGEPLGVEQLPQQIRDNYVGKDGRLLVYAYPKGYLWKKDTLDANRRALRDVSENSTSIGLAFLHIIEMISIDVREAVWLSLLFVFILVFADFRRLATALLALVPLVLSAIWMVGTMTLLGIKFNLVNVAVIPLIIGIGIDDGVHIVHRYRMEAEDRIHRAVLHTGRAVVLTSLTTVCGFGSLGFASYVLIASLGWVLAIGVTYCLLASVLVLPMVMSYVEKWAKL
ncbi:MAG: MMPL family transporter [Deltaproteobacteria bacterium]|nr:MMPL family transporter [Deltaproteobacteria bacterium]